MTAFKQLQHDLKELVGNSRFDEVFRRLKDEVLRLDCELYNDVIIIQSRYSDSKRAGTLGTIDFQEKNLQFNNVSQALVWVIDAILPAHLLPGLQQQPATDKSSGIPPYHAYTCDRVDQSDAFEHIRAQVTPGSSHFVYLYGGELQAHKSFFARIAYDLEGRYRPDDSLPDAPKTQHRAVQISFAVDECRDPQVLRERFVRNLFTAFGLAPEDYHPLLQRNIGVLIENSEKTKYLGPKDYLCVFVHISHWAWNKKLTPEAARWFISTFCDCTLRENGPAILFFFAFDYDEDLNPGVRAEVLDAVQQGEDMTALPELNMVLRKDVALWLVRYQNLFPSAEQRKNILVQRFTDEEYYMEDVEIELQKLIDNYLNNNPLR